MPIPIFGRRIYCCNGENQMLNNARRNVPRQTKDLKTEVLFPKHESTTRPPCSYDVSDGAGSADKLISYGVLTAAAEELKTKGPQNAFSDIFRSVLQKCLEGGYFPNRWKVKKAPGKSSSV